jgi:hypothetical protein
MICRYKMLYISGMARVDVAIILAMAACTGTGFIQGTSVQMVVLISSTDSEIPEGVTSSGRFAGTRVVVRIVRLW